MDSGKELTLSRAIRRLAFDLDSLVYPQLSISYEQNRFSWAKLRWTYRSSLIPSAASHRGASQTQLENMENLASPEGPFLAGPEVSVADATVWPTMVFIRFMMPKFDREESTYLGPKLSAWCKHMDQHPVAKR